MATKKQKKNKKFFSIAEANAALPLIRAIVTDITVLANDLHSRHERITRARSAGGTATAAHQEEAEHAQREFERGEEKLRDYEMELRNLGVLLKDYFTGLIDFPCWMDNREVYLCWRLGEPEVSHWHEVDAGFAGRRKLETAAAN